MLIALLHATCLKKKSEKYGKGNKQDFENWEGLVLSVHSKSYDHVQDPLVVSNITEHQ